MNLEITSAADLNLSTKRRSGYATTLMPKLSGMEPGQALVMDVDFSALQSLSDEAAMIAYATENGVKIRAGEEVTTALSRFLANQQRTRVMAALDLTSLSHYFRSQLLDPVDGIYAKMALICEPIGNKPIRKTRTKKPAKATAKTK